MSQKTIVKAIKSSKIRVRQTLNECLAATRIHINALTNYKANCEDDTEWMRSGLADVLEGLEITASKIESLIG